MRYKEKGTDNIFIRQGSTNIKSAYGEIPASIYFNVQTEELIVVSDEQASDILESALTKCPIDVYAILHQQLNKGLAAYLADIIEARIVHYLEQFQNKNE